LNQAKIKQLSDEELRQKIERCEREYICLTDNPDSWKKLRDIANLEKNLIRLGLENERRKTKG
jgi:hypothetical protein